MYNKNFKASPFKLDHFFSVSECKWDRGNHLITGGLWHKPTSGFFHQYLRTKCLFPSLYKELVLAFDCQSHHTTALRGVIWFPCCMYGVFNGENINFGCPAIIALEILALCKEISLELCFNFLMYISYYYLTNMKHLF